MLSEVFVRFYRVFLGRVSIRTYDILLLAGIANIPDDMIDAIFLLWISLVSALHWLDAALATVSDGSVSCWLDLFVVDNAVL